MQIPLDQLVLVKLDSLNLISPVSSDGLVIPIGRSAFEVQICMITFTLSQTEDSIFAVDYLKTGFHRFHSSRLGVGVDLPFTPALIKADDMLK